MKNSAWYQKLLQKKLDKLPLDKDPGSEWLKMQQLLDEHMPVTGDQEKSRSVKSFGATIVSMLGFILPAAAMIGTVTFIIIKHPVKSWIVTKAHHTHYHKRPNNVYGSDSSNAPGADSTVYFSKDSITNSQVQQRQKAVKNDSVLKSNAQNQITAQQNGKIKRGYSSVNSLIIPGSSKYAASPFSLANMQNKKGSQLQHGYLNNSSKNLYQNTVTLSGTKPIEKGGDLKKPENAVLNAPASQTADDKNAHSVLATTNKQADQSQVIPGEVYLNGKRGSDSAQMLKDNKVAEQKIKAGNDKQAISGRSLKTSKTKAFKAPGLNDDAEYAPNYNLNAEVGLNTSGSGKNLVLGLGYSKVISSGWNINTGIRFNIAQSVSDNYSPKSYNMPDSLKFKVAEKRRIYTFSVPINLEYKVSRNISFNAGPSINILAKQVKQSSTISQLNSYRDTLNHSKTIDSVLNHTHADKVQIGISGGVKIHLNRFYIEGRYMQNITPYKFTNDFGVYKQFNRSFQIGIGLQLKK